MRLKFPSLLLMDHGRNLSKRFLLANLCLIFALTLSACANTASQKAGANCTLVKVASLQATVTPTRQILIPVGINGSTVMLQLDTGADQTVLFADAARRLGLTPKTANEAKLIGVNGETLLYRVPVEHFTMGEMIHPDKAFTMAVIETRRMNPDPSVAGLLGSDYLKHFDLEFDLDHKAINLFVHHPCEGQAAYWPHEIVLQTKFSYGTLPGRGGQDVFTTDSHIMIPIEINGYSGLAALDSGAFSTAMTWKDARAFGITQETEGVRTGGSLHGIGDKEVESASYVIPSVKMGDEIMHKVVARIYRPVRDHEAQMKILFGVDFLLKNRVYIAFDEQRIYFTPYRYRLEATADTPTP